MLTKKIDKKQVEDFLLKNPDFFCDTPSILARLNFPVKEESGERNIVSFKDWMISSLKNQKKEIIENAKHNYFTQRKIHSSILDIIKFSNFKDFLSFIKNDFRKNFDLEMVNLMWHICLEFLHFWAFFWVYYLSIKNFLVSQSIFKPFVIQEQCSAI